MHELFLQTDDKTKIAVNHYKTNHNEVLIMVPGWFMTKDSKLFSDMAEIFSKHFDVLSMDCRGHGNSSGFYTFTTRETEDLKTVVDFAKLNYKKIYLIGFSLGGGLVIIHAGLQKDVDKIIAVSAHYSFEKIENQMWRSEAWVPTFKKMELKRWFSVRPSCIIREKIKPVDVVDKIEVPTLFTAGRHDPTVHAWHTKRLYKKAKCRKIFRTV